MLRLVLLILASTLNLSYQAETDSLAEAKNYTNIDGTQIYLFTSTKAFSYISIDSTVKDKMKATVYLYLTTPVTSISNGVYTSIGFGTVLMKDSDILLCAVTGSEEQWCKDYLGVKDDIVEVSLKTKLLNKKINSSLGAGWSPYVTQVTWEIERTMDPTGAINGTIEASYAYGSLNSAGIPQEHPKGYYNGIRTGDGNTGLRSVFLSPLSIWMSLILILLSSN